MSIECYDQDCQYHNKQEPFCDEDECRRYLVCGRCYEEVDQVFPASCNEKPEKYLNAPLGQYHCPDCGAMVLAGVPHPTVCKRCLTKTHPSFDRT